MRHLSFPVELLKPTRAGQSESLNCPRMLLVSLRLRDLCRKSNGESFGRTLQAKHRTRAMAMGFNRC